ncbi:MAG: tetratricopeptide repeat protein [Cyanobacteria bacterium CRU_2_1]|nr:tetratricopeptide repeat protein [Cyanobacteria bacterium RU_5_0]NJR58025.1 tetratricopeptide repeat protein [Cyanobacteria bacterium CRU_2_1]
MEFTPSEAEIWSLRGQHEFQKNELKQAETSFRHALELGLGEAYYWIARCLLAQNRLDTALEFIRSTFEQGSLPKDYAICYLKLLLLKGDTATIEHLISKQSKRFSAAQLHWTRGILALKADDPDAARTSFYKIKRPLTPGDLPEAWVVYAQQQMENWDVSSGILGLKRPQSFGFSFAEPKYLKQPILQRLALIQQAKTGEPPLTPSDLRRGDAATQEAIAALAILQLAEQGDYHNAAHALLNLGHRSPRLPELTALRPTVLMLAGDQALKQGEPKCSETFWKPLLSEQPFNPQLAVNLLTALELNESDQERQRLVTRLLKWVEQNAKQHPENWTGNRLNLTLAHLHCRLADAWVSMGRYRAAIGSVQQAERIYPTSPEVIGRKGLLAASEEKHEEAVKLLTQALEQGCRYEEVYGVLLGSLDELNNPQAKVEVRRRFGKYFGDLNPEAEIKFATWLDALYTRTYAFFSRLVQPEKNPDPPLRACQIFVEAVQGSPTSGGKVSLNQEQAKQQWDALLDTISGEPQIPTLQAIALCTYLFAKREKGIAALINHYTQRLFELSSEFPQAREAHLVVLAVKETNLKKLESPIRSYLDTMPQPGNALAQIQLQVRRFGWSRNLISFLEAALKQEPQNPLLLLARATTYPLSMPQYEELKQQGFEIARRIQDAKALQAFREEQAFLNLREAQSIMPNPEAFDNFNEDDLIDVVEGMLRRMFGQQIPKADLDRMMPELKRQMLNNMPDFMEDDEEEDFDLDAIFGKTKKRKRSFRDL